MIVVVDYGVGNLSSVRNMLARAGAEVKISKSPDDVLAAEKLLLPGVGHFDHGMNMLNASGLRGVIERCVLELARPVLGICLGAQMLGKGSEEGDCPGLGWIDMECRRLQPMQGLRVPHMGWGEVKLKKLSPLLAGMDPHARFYFVHSYFMQCVNEADVVATAIHGIEFACAVQCRNIFGTQFHPEKSLKHGLALMRAFAEYQPI